MLINFNLGTPFPNKLAKEFDAYCRFLSKTQGTIFKELHIPFTILDIPRNLVQAVFKYLITSKLANL